MQEISTSPSLVGKDFLVPANSIMNAAQGQRPDEAFGDVR
jgi:hypothetical protein